MSDSMSDREKRKKSIEDAFGNSSGEKSPYEKGMDRVSEFFSGGSGLSKSSAEDEKKKKND